MSTVTAVLAKLLLSVSNTISCGSLLLISVHRKEFIFVVVNGIIKDQKKIKMKNKKNKIAKKVHISTCRNRNHCFTVM